MAKVRPFDPYKNFKFKVFFGEKPDPVAGVSKVSALKRTTEVIEHRSGGDPSSPRKAPGQTKYEPITLERGVTHDTEFEKWANKCWYLSGGDGKEMSLGDFRKDIRIEMYNEAGQRVLAYEVADCWVSEYQALPELDANGNAVAIQTLKLENQGWERALDVTPPGEVPTFTVPEE
jgi:phage tail-like protein